MDTGWKFHRSDVELPPVLSKSLSYQLTKSERGYGPAAHDYLDWDWETVRLPHDYCVEETPDPRENECHGYLKRDNAWYRRSFRLEEADRGNRLCLYFEGGGTRCTIWVNGHLLLESVTATTPFEVDFTDVAIYGQQPNVVSVYVQNQTFEGWYYEGCGLTGHVWLEKTDLVAVDRWGVYIRPEKEENSRWNTQVQTTLRNDRYEAASLDVTSEILDADQVLARAVGTLVVAARDTATLSQQLPVESPELWSLEDPRLYTLRTRVYEKGSLVDETLEPYGYRTIRFDADHGFFLNETPVKLKGVCVHQHHGMLGGALPDALYEMRIDRLKQMGTNAYRTSHYPQAEALMAECDRQGMLVMDELRLFDSSPEALRQASVMVRRDRNHPSVILWCAGNEELIQATEKAGNILRAMRHEIRRWDDTRPVTMAMNEGILSNRGVAAACDVIGINYYTQYYDDTHRLNPHKPIIGAELYSTAPDPHAGNVPQGIDDWRQVNERDFVAGLFIWTGLDYRGENFWPRIHSGLGALDENGMAKESFYRYQAYWTQEPMAYVANHWNHAAGELVAVDGYTNLPWAELFLNGQSLGKQQVDPYEMVQWQVPFASGTLCLRAWDDQGREATHQVTTAGPAVRLIPSVYRKELRADGEDLLILELQAVDQAGTPVPLADQDLQIQVSGQGRYLSCSNGDICAQDPWPLGQGKLFEGRAQILVQTTAAAGPLRVEVRAWGLEPCVYETQTLPAQARPAVADMESVFSVGKMNISPVWPLGQAPSIESLLAVRDPSDFCMSFWPVVVLDGLPPEKLLGLTPGIVGYGLYVDIPASGSKTLRIPQLRGEARFLVLRPGDETRPDLIREFYKETKDAGPLDLDLSAYEAGDSLIIMGHIQAETEECGIIDPLYWVR